MSRNRKKARLVPAIALLMAGMVIGIGAVTPASAHFKKKISHLGSHMKSLFFTKSQTYSRTQANGIFAGICFPVDGALLANAHIDDAGVAAVFGAGGVTENQCAPMEIRSTETGKYEIAVAPGFLSSIDCPADIPVAQVTPVGTNVQTSYEITTDVDDRTIIRVHRTAGDGTTYVDGNFSFALTDWIFGDCVVPRSAAERTAGATARKA